MDLGLRKSGIPTLEEIPWGAHLSQFYSNPEELLEILIPYLRSGLENNEFCMCITSGPLGHDGTFKALRSGISGFDEYLSRGQIEVLPHGEWYCGQDGFIPERVIEGWRTKLSSAIEKGYEGIRITGNVFWLKKEDWKAFNGYEQEVDNIIGKTRIIALCSYPIAMCGAGEVADVVSSHKYSLIKRGGKWEILESLGHKRAQAELFESEEKYRGLFESINDGILICGMNGEFRDCNQAFLDLTGYSKKEMIGKAFKEITPPEWHKKTDEILENLVSGRGYANEFEKEFIRQDGSIFPASLKVWVTKDENGAPFETGWSIRDITGRKQAEAILKRAHDELEIKVQERTKELRAAYERLAADNLARKKAEGEKEKMEMQLLQAHKTETIGRLTGGIAHDFNNIITAISSFAALAAKEQDIVTLREHVNEIKEAAETAKNLTRQLLIFSKKMPFEPKSVSINNTVSRMLTMLQRIIGENITVRADLDPKLWAVKADYGNIEQLVMNLVVNSKDALPEGGDITIRTSNDSLPDGSCKRVMLAVEDNGTGMDSIVLENLFEPFFSTKGPGKGIGLGLSVVQNIVKAHHGEIMVESLPGKGSKFSIYFPAITGAHKEERLAPNGLNYAFGEKVLIIEDERVLRKIVAITLSKYGFNVFEAEDAREAALVFEKENGGVDLVFSDIILKDGTGIQVVQDLLLKKPDLKVVLTSGYMDIESQWPVIKEMGFSFLQKPYEIPDLLDSIRKSLQVEALD